MLYCTSLPDPLIALEACDFWLVLTESECQVHMQAHLADIVPVLVRGMVYSAEDLIDLERENDNEFESEQDIRPRHHKARNHAAEQHDDSDENDDEDEEPEDSWNVRKCCASAVDVMATVYGDDLLPYILPAINAQLCSTEWQVREAGILALGAISDGCMNGMEPHLATIIPILTTCLQDQKALIRSITCWTLSRYACWIVPTGRHADSSQQIHLETYFYPILQGVHLKLTQILALILDKSKQVQKAACSSLASFEEEAGELVVPLVGPIVHNLALAFPKYHAKNLLILYDTVAALADAVGPELGKPEYLDLLMPAVIGKWAATLDFDPALFSLFEVLKS